MSHATADRYAWIEPGVEDLGGGVHRIPLPLPIDGLKAVNVYAIADPGGVDLIDAGIALVPARERLAAGLRQIGYELATSATSSSPTSTSTTTPWRSSCARRSTA